MFNHNIMSNASKSVLYFTHPIQSLSSFSSSSLSHQVANSRTQIRLKSSRFIDHYLYVAAVDGPNYHPTGSTGELTYESVIETVALSVVTVDYDAMHRRYSASVRF